MMLVSVNSCVISHFKPSPSVLTKNKKNGGQVKPTLAKKPNATESSGTREPIFPLRVSKAFLAKSAVAVFALGFLDAGYSGDWSRIGVISKETEDLLKFAAYLIVPSCVFLIISLSDGSRD